MKHNLNETSIQNALTKQFFMEVQFVAKLLIKNDFLEMKLFAFLNSILGKSVI